jgi:hypothetical protein
MVMEIIVVDLMVCRAVTVVAMGVSAILLTSVTFGVLLRMIQVVLGIEIYTIIIRNLPGAKVIRVMACLFAA